MTSRRFASDRFLFGGDYNPEQWSRHVWAQDLELMIKARVNTVTIGVFSWALLEPREGEFEPQWLDDVIAGLHDAGIGFFLATPTASPPPWFSLAHPDGLPVRQDGTRLTHGSRDTYAISSPDYRAAARRVARFLADRYGEHPGLRGWHVHNEYGTLDYGPHAAAAFRRWLQDRYRTLEAVNREWTTAFWSQNYTEWKQIEPPRATGYLHNPAHAVDFKRFSSDEMLAAFIEQKQEIIASGSRAPITTNFMLPTWNHLDQWSWADAQDVVSIDHYLDTVGPDGEAHVAYCADLTRAWADGPWVLMEQNATGIRVGDRTFVKEADRMIRNSLGYIARGSQSSLFFQWRASSGGSEQWHGALVPHAGEDSDAFRAVETLGKMLEKIEDVVEPPADGVVNESRIAIVWHAEGWWSLETPHTPNDAVTYSDEIRATHRAFWRAGVPVDFVRPGADVSGYAMVIVPVLPAIEPEIADWLSRFVRKGGHLVTTYLTGTLDANQRVLTGGYPGALRDLLGIRVEEIRPLAPQETVALSDGSLAESWTERVRLEGAEVLAAYAEGPLSGLPAITRRVVGTGTATYISAALIQDDRDRLAQELAILAGASPVIVGAQQLGVEAVRRRGANGDFLFVLHHGEIPVRVIGSGVDLLTGRADDLVLEPGSVAVIRETSSGWSIKGLREARTSVEAGR